MQPGAERCSHLTAWLYSPAKARIRAGALQNPPQREACGSLEEQGPLVPPGGSLGTSAPWRSGWGWGEWADRPPRKRHTHPRPEDTYVQDKTSFRWTTGCKPWAPVSHKVKGGHSLGGPHAHTNARAKRVGAPYFISFLPSRPEVHQNESQSWIPVTSGLPAFTYNLGSLNSLGATWQKALCGFGTEPPMVNYWEKSPASSPLELCSPPCPR